MKLKKEFISHCADDETLLIPTGNAPFSGLIKGNTTFGAIVELLQKDTDEASVIQAMKQRFDAPDEVISRDVRHVLAELRRIGAIDG